MELRQRVFELEGQVSDLEGKLALADDARLGQSDRGEARRGKWRDCLFLFVCFCSMFGFFRCVLFDGLSFFDYV